MRHLATSSQRPRTDQADGIVRILSGRFHPKQAEGDKEIDGMTRLETSVIGEGPVIR
jgi:hypothetical protein